MLQSNEFPREIADGPPWCYSPPVQDSIRYCPRCGGYFRAVTHCQRDGEVLQDTDAMVDRYRITDRVGEGGMGVVYKAEHALLDNRTVAVKLLHREHVRDDVLVQRFFREARASSRVENEHIVEVVDFGVTESGDAFLVMEFVTGLSLRDRIDEAAPLSLDEAFSIGIQTAEALYATHSAGIVHRDLKPGNILLIEGPSGRQDFVKLLDFGIAQLSDYQDARITRAGMIIGTPAYMSPEQASGQSVDQATDIYALGTMIYEMLTGRCPFVGANAKEVLIAQLTQEPTPPRQLRADIPGPVERVLLRCLRKESVHRPRTMMHLAYELRDALTRQSGALPAVVGEAPEVQISSETEIVAAPSDAAGPAGENTQATARSLSGFARRFLWIGGLIAGVVIGVLITLMVVRSPEPVASVALAGSDAGAESGPSRSAQPPSRRRRAVASSRRRRARRATRVKSRPRRRTRTAATPKKSRFGVQLRSVPSGATVIDGSERLGRAPLRVATDRSRSVSVYLDGYEERTVQLAARRTGTLTVKLKRHTMSWEISSLSQLKKMRQAGKISRYTYQRRRKAVLRKRDRQLVRLRVEYKMGLYTKAQYDRQVKAVYETYR